MLKVKTFTTELRPFHTVRELGSLDEQVNAYLQENNIAELISVSDTCTTDDSGATIGLIRVISYRG
jgi:hypothetical protein